MLVLSTSLQNKIERSDILSTEGKEIKRKLFDRDLTQVWLIGQLKEKGCLTDKTELSSALSGSRKGPKVDRIIKLSKEILGC